MGISNKHLAAFILGAAAAYGAYVYSKMTEEEKQKLADSVKDKFSRLKAEAEKTADTAKNYFNDLKEKVSGIFKEHFPEAKQHFEDIFNEPKNEESASANS